MCLPFAAGMETSELSFSATSILSSLNQATAERWNTGDHAFGVRYRGTNPISWTNSLFSSARRSGPIFITLAPPVIPNEDDHERRDEFNAADADNADADAD